MRRAIAAATILALTGCATHRGEPAAVPYIDAHSHLVPVLTPDEEIARFRAAGIAA